MSLNYNPETREIICPCADTGTLMIDLLDVDEQPFAQPVNGLAILAVCEKISTGYQTVAEKIAETARTVDEKTGIETDTATFIIDAEFSGRITPGKPYFWDVRVVKGGKIVKDANGNDRVVCDEVTDEVHSVFASQIGVDAKMKELPKYAVPGVAVNVGYVD